MAFETKPSPIVELKNRFCRLEIKPKGILKTASSGTTVINKALKFGGVMTE